MKICFLIKDLNIKTGLGRYAREVVESVSKQNGIEVIVLTEKKSDYGKEKMILSKSYLLRNIFGIFLNAVKARKYIRECDVIHALDGYAYGVISALANIGLNRKLFISTVGTYSVLPLDRTIQGILLRWAYKKADKILCISKFTKERIMKRIKLDNLEVVNLGVDYEKFQAPRASTKHDGKIILSVGALKPRKGYEISIPAIAEIKNNYKNIKYFIVGGAPSPKYLDLVGKYGLKNDVVFLDKISDKELVDLYLQCDIFLLTPVIFNDNDFEGFGLVYLEAGACGKPVIGTYGCGAEDAIVDGSTGILVLQNDVAKTAEAISKLLGNPELAERMGENGRERARQMSWASTAKKYIENYENIIRLR